MLNTKAVKLISLRWLLLLCMKNDLFTQLQAHLPWPLPDFISHPFLSIHLTQTMRRTKYTISLLILYQALWFRGHNKYGRTVMCSIPDLSRQYRHLLVYYSLDCFQRSSYSLPLHFFESNLATHAGYIPKIEFQKLWPVCMALMTVT